MKTHRFSRASIALALAIALAFTVREALATSAIGSEGPVIVTCNSLPSRYSIASEDARDSDVWIPRTEDGPTGVDGGLIELLSGYRTCSR